MYELMAQLAKYVLIALIYYFLYNFLKVMIADLTMQQNANRDTGFFLLTEDGREYPLFNVNTIGRAGDSDIIIEDPYLSSKHALIARRGRRMIIEDLHSTNGTFVNGKRVKKPVALKDRDEIVLGGKKFIFLRRETGGVKDGSRL
ncbi:FHA domain-containing protein [Thermoanaerobacterium sp. DL9XJH110]|uniref:FHA domain-containing protein n=1 Tax=Thermoanaerobacterium sp. DL9XJH110 TaxID=3386643 RepID=UPI003BB7198B